MGLLDSMPERLSKDLEPMLSLPDPRTKISAYHDMPYAIFHYRPEEEFALRKQVRMLQTRLEMRGKRVTRISLAECLDAAMRAVNPLEAWFDIEREMGTEMTVDTVHAVLSAEERPLADIVAERMPPDPDPLHDIVFIVRAGALFPVYRTSALLEQLQGRVRAPTVLFFPGVLEGPAGLKFMGVLDAEHNYRPKIL